MTRHHLPRPVGRRSLRWRDQKGAAAVEFALVILPLIFVLYGLIAFGMMLALKQSVTSAAADGARSVVGVTDDTTTVADERLEKAKTTVAARLNWLGSKYSPSDVKVSWYDPATLDCNYAAAAPVPPAAPAPVTVCVKITYPYSTRPLVPLAPGLGLVTPDNLGSEARVQVG